MASIDVAQLTKAVGSLVKTLNPRNRDIVSRRFGLKNGSCETLEAIGKSYGITRERVRQIEEFALTALTKTAAGTPGLAKTTDAVRDLIARQGGVVRERALFKLVSGTEKDTAANASLSFALTLDPTLIRVGDNDQAHALWATDKMTLEKFRSQVASLVRRRSMPVETSCRTRSPVSQSGNARYRPSPDTSTFDEKFPCLVRRSLAACCPACAVRPSAAFASATASVWSAKSRTRRSSDLRPSALPSLVWQSASCSSAEAATLRLLTYLSTIR